HLVNGPIDWTDRAGRRAFAPAGITRARRFAASRRGARCRPRDPGVDPRPRPACTLRDQPTLLGKVANRRGISPGQAQPDDTAVAGGLAGGSATGPRAHGEKGRPG